MAAVIICSDLGPQENKVSHCFHCSPIYLPWHDGAGCHDIHFLNVEFSASFFTLLFWTLSKDSLVALHFLPSEWYHLCIWAVWYHLCIWEISILIPAWESSSPAFRGLYSAYKLNKQHDNIRPCRSPSPIMKQSFVPTLVLMVASWPAYWFLRRQVESSGTALCLRIFCSLLWATQSEVLA